MPNVDNAGTEVRAVRIVRNVRIERRRPIVAVGAVTVEAIAVAKSRCGQKYGIAVLITFKHQAFDAIHCCPILLTIPRP